MRNLLGVLAVAAAAAAYIFRDHARTALQVEHKSRCVVARSRLSSHTRRACWKSPRLGCVLDHEQVDPNTIDYESLEKALGPRKVLSTEESFPVGESVDAGLQQDVQKSVDMHQISETIEAHFNDTRLHARAIILIKDGQILYEKYGDGYSPDQRLLGWSMSKSILAALLAMRAHQQGKDLAGLLSMRAEIPEFRGSEREHLTVRQLQNMADGLDFDEFYTPLQDATKMLFLDKSSVFEDRTTLRSAGDFACFHYSSHTSNVLSAVLRETFATREDYLRFPFESLFAKLMPSAVFETDPQGLFVGSSFVWATARDWARFGMLILNDGVWQGERLLPEGWVKFASSAAPNSDGVYGAHFWGNLEPNPDDDVEHMRKCDELFPSRTDPPRDWLKKAFPRGTFLAHGFEEQAVVVAPHAGVVMVRLGATKEVVLTWDKPAFYSRILRAAGVTDV